MIQSRKPVLIAGPTASGKSALALRLAERDGGVIINADAAQVYDCWRVLTARPDDADLARAPHALYGHVPGAVRYSVGDWLRDLTEVLARTEARPIIVGGTGLYFTALTEGLASIPGIPPEVRARSEALLADGRTAEMLADLAREDPSTYARIDRANPMRIQRAWEVLRGTGRALSAWQKARPAPLIAPGDCDRIVLNPEIPLLNSRISDRFQIMLSTGALEECAAFRLLGVDPALPAARVLGAPDLLAHLAGARSLDAASEAAITATRQFAKRQRSWFRGRMADWTWVDPFGTDPLDQIR